MKKIIVLLLISLCLCGCSRETKSSIVKSFTNKINKSDCYYMEGDLELRSNDEVYNYEVEVSFKKKAYYKVSLKNKSNSATQVILKNDDGVYVLTPSLNRSFKFQSDWPYNNSQIYLLGALLNDLKDENLKFKKVNDNYVFYTSVNYPNNKDLTEQKVIISKNLKLKSITVYDKEKVPSMIFNVKKIDYSPSFKKGYFDLGTVMETHQEESNDIQETFNIEDAIYPLALPINTKLSSEEKINKTNGERILMTFDGDKPFLLVEETIDIDNDFTVIPTNGEPYQLMDTLGVMTENSLSWATNGIEYYLVSDVLSQSELVEIAQSIYALPTMK